MKKIIISLLLMAAAPWAFSQELEFGLKAGFSSDNITLHDKGTLDAKVEANTTYNFGVYSRFKIVVIGFFIQPELIYNKRASNFTITDAGQKYTFSHSASYMDVPVLFGFKMFKTFRIYGGPNFQFLVGQNTDIPNNVAAFKKMDLTKNTTGIQLGAGLDLMKFRVDAKYDFNNNSMGSAFEYNGIAPTLKNGMITLQVGIKLFGIL